MIMEYRNKNKKLILKWTMATYIPITNYHAYMLYTYMQTNSIAYIRVVKNRKKFKKR